MAASAPLNSITTIGFGADDTLWHDGRFLRLAEERFKDLPAGLARPRDLSGRLLDAEGRTLGHCGSGMKGYAPSMIEAAMRQRRGACPHQ